MSQVPVKVKVKYAKESDLFTPKEEERDVYVPVIELAALREVVGYLREQVKYHDPLCMDNIEEDGCTCGHATAQRLLALLGEGEK